MTSGINPAGQQFLDDMSRLQSALDLAQRQISSGLRVSVPSDAPDAIGQVLRLRVDIDRYKQVQTNLGNAKTDVNTAEQTLQSAVQLVDRASVLASEGATSTQTAATRQSIALEVDSIHQQLVGLSATQVSGRYIFSGDADTQAPYNLDTTAPDTGGGVVQLTAAAATGRVQDAVGNTFPISLTAQQIFDHQNPPGTLAPDNVFAAVNQLRVALQNNDDAGISNALSSLRQAGDYLNNQLSFYGTAQNRIDSANTQASQLQLQTQTALSQTQDADITAAIVRLTQGQTQQQAALAAQGQRPRTSLFDFLA